MGNRRTDAKVEEQYRYLDDVYDEVVNDLYGKCGLHLVPHLRWRKHLATQAEAIVFQHDNGNKVSDDQQLLV